MKQQLLTILTCILFICTFSQLKSHSKNPEYKIPFNDSIGLKLLLDASGHYSFSSYQFISAHKIAFLSEASNEILVFNFNQTNDTILSRESIDLIDYHTWEAFCFYNNRFFVFGENNLLSFDLSGNLLSRVELPSSLRLLADAIYVENNQVVVLSANGSTFLSDNGTIAVLDTNNWVLPENTKERLEVVDTKRFYLKIQSPEFTYDQFIDVANEYIQGDLAVAFLRHLDIKAHKAFIEIETTSDVSEFDVKKYLLVVDLVNHTTVLSSIPLIKNTYLKNPVSVFNANVYYALSAQDAVYISKVNVLNELQLPQFEYSYLHFNNLVPTTIEVEEVGASKMQGASCVTRTQTESNALNYLNMKWIPSSTNVKNSCTYNGSGEYYRTPNWVVANTTLTSIPYKWGGFTHWLNWKNYIALGRKAGNHFTGINGICSGSPDASSSDGLIIGLDCSGFVSRCWELSYKQSTSGLPSIAASLGAASTTTGFGSLRKGDIVNDAGSHVRMAIDDTPSGAGLFIEAANGTASKVFQKTYSPSDLVGYTSRRFNDIQSIYLSTYAGIKASPLKNNCSASITYSLRNGGSVSWTGVVALVAITANGNAQFLKKDSLVTLTGGQNMLFSYATSNLQLAVGTYTLMVKVKNVSTCDYGLYYSADNYFSNMNVLQVSVGSGTCIATSVNDTEASSLKVFPNPVSGDNFEVSFFNTKEQSITLKIYEVTGRNCVFTTVYNFRIGENLISVNLKDVALAKGVYILLLETESGPIPSKLIVN
ncbi:MAG: T9SS type A sorting domain-containing protein [Bacteroidetes bacterium]|nr:T9SS type A sorting domain-containing protein [Bacteroidota bacterium]